MGPSREREREREREKVKKFQRNNITERKGRRRERGEKRRCVHRVDRFFSSARQYEWDQRNRFPNTLLVTREPATTGAAPYKGSEGVREGVGSEPDDGGKGSVLGSNYMSTYM